MTTDDTAQSPPLSALDAVELALGRPLHLGECPYCGGQFDWRKMHREHVIPKAMGGSDDPSNIIPSCGSCNRIKGGRDVETWVREVFVAEFQAEILGPFVYGEAGISPRNFEGMADAVKRQLPTKGSRVAVFVALAEWAETVPTFDRSVALSDMLGR